MRTILTINAGSSSIKFALFECSEAAAEVADDRLRRLLKGSIDRIGLSDAQLTAAGDDPAKAIRQPVPARDHASAAQALMQFIQAQPESAHINAVAHRIVHGGPKY